MNRKSNEKGRIIMIKKSLICVTLLTLAVVSLAGCSDLQKGFEDGKKNASHSNK